VHEGCQEHTLCVAHMQSIDSLPVQRDRHVHSSVGFTFGEWKQSLWKGLKIMFWCTGTSSTRICQVSKFWKNRAYQQKVQPVRG